MPLTFTGYYMFTYTLLQSTGDNAKLELSVSGNGEPSCLQFYYHMYAVIDSLMGTFIVFSGNTEVFSMSGNHGDNWIKAERTIYLNNTVSLVDMVCALDVLSYRIIQTHRCYRRENVRPSQPSHCNKFSAGIATEQLERLFFFL